MGEAACFPELPKAVSTLERLAAIDGQTVSAALARELRGLVSLPGFAEALL
jgi:hypothetical protein